MFCDRSGVAGAEFPSCWRLTRSVAESGCQTMPSTTAEAGSQARDTTEGGSQTEEAAAARQPPDPAALARFVTSAALLIEEELELVAGSRAWQAFDSYGLEEEGECEVVAAGQAEAGDGWRVSGLAWNSRDSAVVAGLVSTLSTHPAWCDHGPGGARVWRVDRAGQPATTTTATVEAGSCVTAVAPGRQESDLLALGCHTGQIVVERAGSELSAVQQLAGSESPGPVVALLWLARSSLLAIHAAGSLRLYSLDPRKQQLLLKKKFQVPAHPLPRALKPLRSGEVGLVGGVASEADPDSCILATEAGCVVLADLTSQLAAAAPAPEAALDPVAAVFQLHTAAITALALSPYDDNILATAGADLRLLLSAVTAPHSPAMAFQVNFPFKIN